MYMTGAFIAAMFSMESNITTGHWWVLLATV
jgi:hypothetical protein